MREFLDKDLSKKIKIFQNILVAKFWIIWFFATVIAICLSLLFSLPKYGKLPAGLNRDEAALGYNAYSLLKTGKDEWGKSWPISFTSFGDQKLPVYIYTLIPFVAIFGLEIWAIRLPSLLAGLIVIIAMGLITLKLSKISKFSLNKQLIASFGTMILIAISPWHMHFSRVAYETHLAMAFFLSSLACIFFALDVKSKLLQRKLLIAAGFLSGLTLLSYHSYQVFTPLFLLTFLAIFFKKIKKLDKTGLVIGILLNLLCVGLLVGGGVFQANQTKSQGINPFNTQVLLRKATEYRSVSNLPAIVNKVLFNKFTEGIISFAQNYASTFSGTFFFIHGSNHGDHNPGNGNNIHLFLAPFILMGLLALGKNSREKSVQVILVWILLALIPSSLTINPLLEVRIATIFPILELLAIIGIFYFFNFFSKLQKKILAVFLTIIALMFAFRFFIFYTAIAPLTAVDNTHFHYLAKTLYKYRSFSGEIVTGLPSHSPYIWYLFENKINPTFFQEKVIRYPTTDEGFAHVKQLANIRFEKIIWSEFTTTPSIIIISPDEISIDQRLSSQFSLIEVVTDANDKAIYEVWKNNI